MLNRYHQNLDYIESDPNNSHRPVLSEEQTPQSHHKQLKFHQDIVKIEDKQSRK